MPEPRSNRIYNGRSPEERARARKQQLLDAALEIIGTVGFQATRINDICRAAGVSQRYFYESFQDSENLLLQLYQREVERMAQATLGDFDFGGNPVGQVRQVLTRWFATIEANPMSARIIFFEVHGVSKQAEAVYLAMRRAFRDQVAAFVAPVLEGTPSNHLDQQVVAIGVVGALLELVRTWLVGELDLSVDEMVDRLLAVVAQATDLEVDARPR